MTEFQENDLLKKIRDDNGSAFEVVFLRYYQGLCAYAASILGNKDASEEIVQNVFVKLWENRKKLAIESSLKAYLYRTVHNQCINQIESLKIRNQYTKKHTIVPFEGDYPIANLIAQELEEKIKHSIDSLPDQCREIFTLIRLQNKSYQEVADKLGISLNTVKTQMQRAISKLKESLREYLPSLIIISTAIF